MVYPKNEMIEQVLAQAMDAETGELLLTDEELAERLAAVELEFDDKIKALRNSYLADKLIAECVAAEASAIYRAQQETSKRAKSIENRAERTKRFIAYLLKGEKFEKDGVRISYITRQETVIDDGFLDWAIHNAPGLLNDPTIRKKDLTDALKAGEHIECARLEPKKYVQVK